MDQFHGTESFLEANNRTAREEYPRPNIYCRVPKSPPLELIMSQMNSVHILISYYFKIHFNITLPSRVVFQVVAFFQIFRPKLCIPFPSSHS